MSAIDPLLGYLFNFCYTCVNDYILSLVLFTLLTKIILLPVSIFVQKNSIKMVKMTPALNNIKCEYYGDKDRINEETLRLYKKEKYSPFVSIIPLILQLILLMGVIDVIKMPVYSNVPETAAYGFGHDLNLVPAEAGGFYIIFPIIAALSSLVMCITQNISQALQAEQSRLNKYGMLAFSVGLSLYLGFFVKAGVAIYWTASNVFSIIQMYLLNAAIDPKKYIDYDTLNNSVERLNSLKAHNKNMTPEMKKRQNEDYRKFFSINNKHVVFYSESSGFYKYFKRLIEWLTSHSDVKIHYVTSDFNDAIFETAKTNHQIIPYYIGNTKLISLFLKMDAQVVVMTMPDLDKYHLKKSYVKKDIDYIFVDHAMTSNNLTLRKGALDAFDTIFCTGQHSIDEMRAQERVYSLPEKRLVKYGYGLIEDLSESYADWCRNNKEQSEPFILLAPSHQKDNILDSCLDNVVDGLSRCAKVIIRPHPQYIKRYPDKWESIVNKYKDDPRVETQSDFSSNDTIYKAALVVSDWSNIVVEYAFSTLRPVMFVDTPIKIINPDYKDIDVEPIDISLRNKIGRSVSGNDADEVFSTASSIINDGCVTASEIEQVRNETVFNFMHSSTVGGRYILSSIKSHTQKEHL